MAARKTNTARKSPGKPVAAPANPAPETVTETVAEGEVSQEAKDAAAATAAAAAEAAATKEAAKVAKAKAKEDEKIAKAAEKAAKAEEKKLAEAHRVKAQAEFMKGMKAQAKRAKAELDRAGAADKRADDLRVTAAIELANMDTAWKEAKPKDIKLVDFLTEQGVVSEEPGRSYENVRKLVAIGKADDPHAAIADMRAKNAVANKKSRDAAAEAVVQPVAPATPAEVEPDTEDAVSGWTVHSVFAAFEHLNAEDQFSVLELVTQHLEVGIDFSGGKATDPDPSDEDDGVPEFMEDV